MFLTRYLSNFYIFLTWIEHVLKRWFEMSSKKEFVECCWDENKNNEHALPHDTGSFATCLRVVPVSCKQIGLKSGVASPFIGLIFTFTPSPHLHLPPFYCGILSLFVSGEINYSDESCRTFPYTLKSTSQVFFFFSVIS